MGGWLVQTVRVWAGQEDGSYDCRHIIRDHVGEVKALSLHATGNYFVSASSDKSWGFYELSTGTCLTQVCIHTHGMGAHWGGVYVLYMMVCMMVYIMSCIMLYVLLYINVTCHFTRYAMSMLYIMHVVGMSPSIFSHPYLTHPQVCVCVYVCVCR